jgi:hypothetical protein
MQKAARHVVVDERVVDGVARHHQRQRQVAAADALRQAQEVGPDARLLAREEGAGAPAAHRDLVGDQVHAMAVAQRAHAAQVGRVVHGHAGGALHQRLDDDGGDGVVPLGQQRLERVRGAVRDGGGVFARPRMARIGRGDEVRVGEQRRVGIAEHRHVAHVQRAERFAVVALPERDEALLAAAARVAPCVKAHLQRDLHRRGAVGRVEAMAQRMPRERGEPLGQLHRRRVRAAREHHVREPVELVFQRGVERRVRMPEQVDPPRAGGVEVAAAFGVDEPHALAARDGQRRRRVEADALGAGVPHMAPAALLQGDVGGREIRGESSRRKHPCSPFFRGKARDRIDALAGRQTAKWLAKCRPVARRSAA